MYTRICICICSISVYQWPYLKVRVLIAFALSGRGTEGRFIWFQVMLFLVSSSGTPLQVFWLLFVELWLTNSWWRGTSRGVGQLWRCHSFSNTSEHVYLLPPDAGCLFPVPCTVIWFICTQFYDIYMSATEGPWCGKEGLVASGAAGAANAIYTSDSILGSSSSPCTSSFCSRVIQ